MSNNNLCGLCVISAPLRETKTANGSRRGAEEAETAEKRYESMSEATQALCFMAGANSIFTGDKLLTAANAGDDVDAGVLFRVCNVLEMAK